MLVKTNPPMVKAGYGSVVSAFSRMRALVIRS